jgi:hypothetical protein
MPLPAALAVMPTCLICRLSQQNETEQESFMKGQFDAKVALVTSGNPGIGRTCPVDGGRLI